MKSLVVFYKDGLLQTRLDDVPIPVPGPHDVLIRVEVAGCNVKDFKHPLPALYNNALNQGDDCAGTIAGLGSSCNSFHLGERVAGFHRMDTIHGTYAEFAICPDHTVFRIPDHISFEEAATIPLAAYTAAVGLFRNLALPTPWDRSDDHGPVTDRIALVINAGSTSVGGFAIKLAKMNKRIGPIVATAGMSSGFVRSLGIEAVVDYRSPSLVEELGQALEGAKLRHVFDASNTIQSIQSLTAVMESDSRYTCTSKLYANEALGVDSSMENALKAAGAWYENMFVGDVHGQPFRMGQTAYRVNPGGYMFGAVMSRCFEMALEQGTLRGHPFEVVEGGLHGVQAALAELKDRKRGGNKKLVVNITDTFKVED